MENASCIIGVSVKFALRLVIVIFTACVISLLEKWGTFFFFFPVAEYSLVSHPLIF